MQILHYEIDENEGKNIHRWKRIVMQSIMDLTRELWTIRCRYIHAESVLTANQIQSQRARQLHEDNVHMREQFPIIDRHLLNKKDSYFSTASIDTIEVWEGRVKRALKLLNDVPKFQAILAAEFNFTKRAYIIPEEMDGDSTTIKKRKMQFRSNMDPTWHKRLKLTYTSRRSMTPKRHSTFSKRIRERRSGRNTGSCRCRSNNSIHLISIFNSEGS